MTSHNILSHTHGNFTFTEYIAERDHLVRQIAAFTGQSAANVMADVRLATAGRPNTVHVLATLRTMLADAWEGELETPDPNPF